MCVEGGVRESRLVWVASVHSRWVGGGQAGDWEIEIGGLHAMMFLPTLCLFTR